MCFRERYDQMYFRNRCDQVHFRDRCDQMNFRFAIGFHCFCFLSTMKWKYPLAFQNFPWRSGLCHRLGYWLWRFPLLLFPLQYQVEISTRVLELSLKKLIMPPAGLLLVEFSTTSCFLSTIKWKYPLAFQNFPWPSGLCHRLGYCLWNFPLVEFSTTSLSSPLSSRNIHSRSRTFLLKSG